MEPAGFLDKICEAELLAKIARQDADAFSKFYDQTSAVLFRVTLSIVHENTAAEDVLQEVYMQIWRKAELFDPALGKPISWAIALTRNKALGYLRAKKRRDSGMETMEEAAAEVPGASETGDSSVEFRELTTHLKALLETFPEKQRLAIELSLWNGLPHQEIAARMNEPLGTVKAWIRRGLIVVRRQMNDYLY